MTEAQAAALKWLSDRGGDGVFDKNGCVLAYGETAPVTRATWNALAELGLVSFYKPKPRGRGRIKIVKGATIV